MKDAAKGVVFGGVGRVLLAVGDPAALHLFVELLVQVKSLENKLGRRSNQCRRFSDTERLDRLLQAGNFLDAFQIVLRCHLIGNFDAPAGVEVFDDFLQRVEAEVLIKDFEDRAVHQLFDQLIFLFFFADVFHLDFSRGRSHQRMQIADPRHYFVLLAAQRAFFGIADHAFVVVDRDPHADAGRLIYLIRFARLEGKMAEDFLHEARYFDLASAVIGRSSFLFHDFALVIDLLGIVRADLHVEAVLERRADPSATGVVFRVGAGDNHDVERQADFVAFDLYVFFFHQIEQTDLNFFGQIQKLVDHKNTPINTQHQAIVDGFFVGEVAPFRHFDRINFADNIGDRHVGSRKFFAVAVIAADPLQRQRIAHLFGLLSAGTANRIVRIIVDLASFDDRYAFIQ